MKRFFFYPVALTLVALSTTSFAHDPKLHKKEQASSPDCAQMKDMDMSKMDPNDPVMKAMHDKCKNATGHDDAHARDMKDMPGTDKTPPPADKGKQ